MLCPMAGFVVVVLVISSSLLGGPVSGGSVVVAEDQIGYTARLALALDLVGKPVDGLGAGPGGRLEFLDLGEVHVHPDAAVHRQWRRESDLVQSVVEHHAESVDGADLPQEAGGHPESEEAVLDGLAVETGLGPLGV